MCWPEYRNGAYAAQFHKKFEARKIVSANHYSSFVSKIIKYYNLETLMKLVLFKI